MNEMRLFLTLFIIILEMNVCGGCRDLCLQDVGGGGREEGRVDDSPASYPDMRIDGSIGSRTGDADDGFTIFILKRFIAI